MSFELYNESNSGYLTVPELRQALTHVHGHKKGVKGKLRMVLEIMDADTTLVVDIYDYLQHIAKFPALVFPIFAIQEVMRQYIMGESFWRVTERFAAAKKLNPKIGNMIQNSKIFIN